MTGGFQIDSCGQNGILPSQWIGKAIEAGVISATLPIPAEQIQPNSLDLRLSSRGYRMRCSFLPGREGLQKKRERFSSYVVDLSDDGFVLETNQVYLFELCESLSLPEGFSARANPKSTTGRLDVFCRVLTEFGQYFDEVPAGYHGKLYLEIVPRSFAIRVRPGDSLAQIRFQVGSAVVTDSEVVEIIDEFQVMTNSAGYPIRSESVRINGGFFMSVDLDSADDFVGYRARKNSHPVDLRAVGQADIKQYWERVYCRKKQPVILEPNEFYILASKELISLPPQFCAEMVPFDAGSGELRTHYAGFFDSGFGYDPEKGRSETASAVVLEVRNQDVPFVIEDGHPLFRVILLRNTEAPNALYGARIGSNYQGQRLRLSKQFSQGIERDDSESRLQTTLDLG